MANFCPNCGAQNPAGNNFCERCGSKLAPPVPVAAGVGAVTSAPAETAPPPAAPPPAAAAPAPAPVAAAPAPTYPPPPAGWQPPPPGSAPAGAAVAGVHRLSLPLIVGGIVGALLLVSVIGVVAANISGRPRVDPLPPPVISGPSNPNPPPNTPNNPTTPTTPAGGQTIEVDNIKVIAPANWKVVDKNAAAILLTNGNGIIQFFSVKMRQPQTVAQLLQGDLADDQKTDPNARICRGPAANPLTGMPPGGMFEAICFTAVPQQGASYAAQSVWYETVSADGSTEFAVNIFAEQGKILAFSKEVDAAGFNVTWKLPQ